MLVWLASYPRSGNTLLRQVLKTCFDLDSCEGLELIPEQLRDPDGIRYRRYGTYYLDNNWEEFYQKSRQSSELVLVKTHELPRDDAKTIYVVRDGRLALKSFVKFQDNYHPGTSSFMSLLLGHHRYGEWTSHYRTWCERSARNLLILRFEDLVEPSPRLLESIAEFLGVSGPSRPWVSHLDELRQRHPAYFGSGDRVWKPDAFWTEMRLRSFYSLHGALLTQLGYATAAEVEVGAFSPDSDEAYLTRFVHTHLARLNELQRACDERQQRITEMTAEHDKLFKQLLEEVDSLASACKDREEEILRRVEERENLCQMIDELEADRKSLHQRIQEMETSLRQKEAQLRPLRRYTLLGLLSRLIRI
jgi:hypothetical protein